MNSMRHISDSETIILVTRLPNHISSEPPARAVATPTNRRSLFRTILTQLSLPNVQDEPRPWLARAVLLGARIVTAMVVGSGALLGFWDFDRMSIDSNSHTIGQPLNHRALKIANFVESNNAMIDFAFGSPLTQCDSNSAARVD